MIDGLIDWMMATLEDPTTGVNMTRLSVPREDDAPPPPEVRLYSENESAWVARNTVAPELLSRGPILLLRQAAEFDMPFLPERSEPGTLDLAILMASAGDSSAKELLLQRQLLRSALRSIALALNALTPEPRITRRGCTYEPTGTVTILPAVTTTDSPVMTGVVTSWRVEDPWTLGGPADDDA